MVRHAHVAAEVTRRSGEFKTQSPQSSPRESLCVPLPFSASLRLCVSVPLEKEVFHFCEDFHAANFVSSWTLAWRAVPNGGISHIWLRLRRAGPLWLEIPLRPIQRFNHLTIQRLAFVIFLEFGF